ncbi:unnamed protein product [Brassica oleracea]
MAYPSTTHLTTTRPHTVHATIVHQSTCHPTTCHPTTTHPSTGHQPTTLMSTSSEKRICGRRWSGFQKTNTFGKKDVWKIMKKIRNFLVLFMKL